MSTRAAVRRPAVGCGPYQRLTIALALAGVRDDPEEGRGGNQRHFDRSGAHPHGTAHLVLFWSCLQGTCSRCDDHCQNGGMLDTADCSCKCPLGYFGPSCESFLLGTWTLVNFNEQIAQILVGGSKPLSVCANHWESGLAL